VDFDISGRIAERVRFQLLNDRRFKQTVSVEDFLREWVIRPRIDLEWLNTGSLWRKINFKEGSMSRKKVTLSTVQYGRVVAFYGSPGNFSLVFGTFDRSNSRIYHFTESYVRVWPLPFPKTPDVAPPKPRKRPEITRATIWDRLDTDIV
jgi:hypothetical protein